MCVQAPKIPNVLLDLPQPPSSASDPIQTFTCSIPLNPEAPPAVFMSRTLSALVWFIISSMQILSTSEASWTVLHYLKLYSIYNPYISTEIQGTFTTCPVVCGIVLVISFEIKNLYLPLPRHQSRQILWQLLSLKWLDLVNLLLSSKFWCYRMAQACPPVSGTVCSQENPLFSVYLPQWLFVFN